MSYLEDIRSHILRHNLQNPIDQWWRNKYNVPYGSQQHLDMDMIDMRIAYEEIAMYIRIAKEIQERESDKEDKLINLQHPDTTVKKVVKMSDKEIKNEFDDLDITQFS